MPREAIDLQGPRRSLGEGWGGNGTTMARLSGTLAHSSWCVPNGKPPLGMLQCLNPPPRPLLLLLLLLSSSADRKTQTVHNKRSRARRMTSSLHTEDPRQSDQVQLCITSRILFLPFPTEPKRAETCNPTSPKLHHTCLQSDLVAPINDRETHLIDGSITNSQVGLTGIYY